MASVIALLKEGIASKSWVEVEEALALLCGREEKKDRAAERKRVEEKFAARRPAFSPCTLLCTRCNKPEKVTPLEKKTRLEDPSYSHVCISCRFSSRGK